jgi:uncharacterized protein YoaH (UPF0181 family)
MLESETRYTVDWWQQRSVGELRELSKSGLSGGELTKAAALELERRAREANHRQQQLAEESAAYEKKRRARRLVIAGSVVGVVFALLVVVGFVTHLAGRAIAQRGAASSTPAVNVSQPAR